METDPAGPELQPAAADVSSTIIIKKNKDFIFIIHSPAALTSGIRLRLFPSPDFRFIKWYWKSRKYSNRPQIGNKCLDKYVKSVYNIT